MSSREVTLITCNVSKIRAFREVVIDHYKEQPLLRATDSLCYGDVLRTQERIPISCMRSYIWDDLRGEEVLEDKYFAISHSIEDLIIYPVVSEINKQKAFLQKSLDSKIKECEDLYNHVNSLGFVKRFLFMISGVLVK